MAVVNISIVYFEYVQVITETRRALARFIHAKHTLLTIFRSSEAGRRSAFKSSRRF